MAIKSVTKMWFN